MPKSVALEASEFAQNLTKERITGLRFPLVIKPLVDGAQGKDVLCNIQTLDKLLFFLARAFKHYDQLLIEEFHARLNSYRVLVFNRRVIGVVQRFPAHIIGDGIQTISELIKSTNITRKQINDFLGHIVVDDECQMKLAEQGLSLDDIPACGHTVVLGYTSNATRGGTYASLGMRIGKKNKRLMIKVAALLNLNLAGIDVECADIKIPIAQSNGVIIEVNHRPSVRIHEIPLDGKSHLVTRKIMRSFIFRHPFAYFYSLYSTTPSAFYIKSLIALIVFSLLYYQLIGNNVP